MSEQTVLPEGIVVQCISTEIFEEWLALQTIESYQRGHQDGQLYGLRRAVYEEEQRRATNA